eukprot:TRINITY_DN23902_c0_g2_i1.p1 TRINITY_DN23902_c0_g2~~TRINITY_DN23902_c0_g2_i1.p1  ORF type:complete len:407 (-),score=38.01 TRINITY_DN23902_c0_g2_i1:223-1443(-)
MRGWQTAWLARLFGMPCIFNLAKFDYITKTMAAVVPAVFLALTSANADESAPWGGRSPYGDCFDEPMLTHLCCSREFGPHGDTECWRTLGSSPDPTTWPSIFTRCCLEPAFRRERDAVLVPDVFAGHLEPPVAQSLLLPQHDRRISLVKTGLSTLPGGAFVLPPNASVMINIGSHAHLESEWFERLADSFRVVLCFEPGRTAFMKLRRWTWINVPGRVGDDSLSRLHLFPCAVGMVGGTQGRGRIATLYTSDFAGGQCNSLLRPNPDHGTSWGTAGCGAATGIPDKVFVVSLAEVLVRLSGKFIELLKVDAQGLDLEIIRSGGSLVSEMVARIEIEVADVEDGSSKLLYSGSHTKADAVVTLRSLGFELDSCSPHADFELMEQDCSFVNQRLRLDGKTAARRFVQV